MAQIHAIYQYMMGQSVGHSEERQKTLCYFRMQKEDVGACGS